MPFTLGSLALFAALITMHQATHPLSVPRACLALSAAVLLVPAFGHARRRLRDIGWSGWWLWGLVVPILSLIIWLIMALKKGKPDAAVSPEYSRMAMGFLVPWAIILAMRVFAEPYWIPAGSMKPTLLIGDYLIVTRTFSDFHRGDVVVFRHPLNGTDFIKRVIGVPGDTVQMRDGQVILNDAVLPQEGQGEWLEVFEHKRRANALPRCSNAPVQLGQECVKHLQKETLPDGSHHFVLNIGEQSSDNTDVFRVPDGQYFVIGDNRDNSTDSRIPQSAGGIGFVPEENIVGRAKIVVFSRIGEPGRSFKRIE